jgi:hypothetical protein
MGQRRGSDLQWRRETRRKRALRSWVRGREMSVFGAERGGDEELSTLYWCCVAAQQ